MIYNLFGDNMKKIKKILIIVAVALLAVLIWLLGKIFYAVADPTPVAMYGVNTPRQVQEIFNSRFTSYEGINIEWRTIRELYTTINHLNATNERIVEYIGPKISEINRNSIYTVKLEYDEEGYVCKVIVTENEENNNNTNVVNNI